MTILVTKPLHPPAFHLYFPHYRFHNIWMFHHPHTTKYYSFCDFLMLGDKILHGILREEFFHFTVKLRRQCFIVRKYQSWFIKLCDDVRHGEGLTGTGNSQQSLELVAFLKAPDQLLDCLGLVARGLVFGV